MHGPAPPSIDAEDLLRRWLAEDDVLQASALLETLLVHAESIVRRIVGFKLCRRGYDRKGGIPNDTDDVCNNALANLISRLTRIKAGGGHTHIQNFGDYTAGIAFNACSEYFRQRHPERYSLAGQLRYLLRHGPGLGLWKSANDIELCGDVAWEGRDAVSPTNLLRGALQRSGSRRLSVELLVSIFRENGGPLEFETLVDEVAGVLGIRIRFTDVTELDQEYSPARYEPSIEEQLCARQFLQGLWMAICGLPLQQRRALLLNMKDTLEGDIGVFDWCGIATIQQIAETIEISLQDFARLWQELPISDERIAKLCGISVQDVINRRSSARKTLKKRIKDLEHGNSQVH
jgi:DNA-directed RNA polymerase specialized sigma24 family protein